MSDAEPEPESFQAGRRRLCPDGDCVGLVGPDGRCRVCGTVDEGAATAGLGPDAFAGGCASDEEDEDEGPDSGHHTGEHADRDGVLDVAYAAPDFDPARKLCPDGDCVGVLGADGRCKVCGRSASDSARAPEAATETE
jgi:hypothetical protein